MLYLTMFALSTGCFCLSETDRIHNIWLKRGLAAIGILLPAVMAGLRASTIGTDVTIYAIKPYSKALNTSGLLEYLSYWMNKHSVMVFCDQLFWTVVYLCTRICPDYHFGLFVYNLLVILFLYLGMKRCHKLYSINVAIGMLCCYLLLYNLSLNIMRNMIAVAIVFYAVTFLPEHRYLRGGIFCVIAAFFHGSGLVGAGIFLLYLIYEQRKGDSVSKEVLKSGLLLVAFAAILLFGETILRALVDAGILWKNYLRFLPGGDFAEAAGSYTILQTIRAMLSVVRKARGRRAIVFLIISAGGYLCFREKSKDSLFYFMCAVSLLLLMMVSGVSSDLSRLGCYFLPLLVVNCQLQIRNISESAGRKWYYIMMALLLVFLLFDWHHYFVQGYSETAPYMFYWDEIS